MRTVQARTQSTQSSRRSGDKRLAPDTGFLNCPKPAAAQYPAAAIPQGWKGGSPEGGEGGIRKSRRPHSLVPPQGAIKSTRAMRYSSLKKPEENPKAKRRFLIKNRKKSADCKSNKPYRKYSQSRTGWYFVPAAREYSRLQIKRKRRGTSPGKNKKIRVIFSQFSEMCAILYIVEIS